jgi:WD40 repeat protein
MPLHSFLAHINSLNCLDWHPNDENILVSGSNDRYIKVWDVRTETLTKQMQPAFLIYSPQSVKKC